MRSANLFEKMRRIAGDIVRDYPGDVEFDVESMSNKEAAGMYLWFVNQIGTHLVKLAGDGVDSQMKQRAARRVTRIRKSFDDNQEYLIIINDNFDSSITCLKDRVA